MAGNKRLGRAVVPALLVPLGLVPLGAHALGLGALRVSSALGQPLNASIELIGATPAEAELATISLASPEAHQRLGVDSALGGVTLRFVVKVGSNGRSYVSVSSYQPVREPYIDFVVEAVSPTGQVARHYTVLLDPVGVAAAPAPVAAWSPPVTAMAPVPAQAAPHPRQNPFANIGVPKAGSTFGPVPPGATLWAIARRVRPGGADIEAVMSTILRANPQAFIGGDPSRLRAGSRLTIPDVASLRGGAVEQAPAAQETTPVDAPVPAESVAPAKPMTPAEPATPAPQAAGAVDAHADDQAPGAEVRVLRSQKTEPATQAVAGSAPQGVSGNRIALLEEALDAAQQHNESLAQRMSLLEEQIRTLTELAKANSPDTAGGTAPEQVPADAVPPPEHAAVAPEQPASPPAVTAEVAPVPAAPQSQPQAEQSSGPPFFALAAATGIGLGGLLLWARRRRAAAGLPSAVIDDEPSGPESESADGAVAPEVPAPSPEPGTVSRLAPVAWVQTSPVLGGAPVSVPEPPEDGFGDPVDTQIDLLTAYVGMADGPSARQIHDEIQRTGTPAQKAQASALLARLDA